MRLTRGMQRLIGPCRRFSNCAKVFAKIEVLPKKSLVDERLVKSTITQLQPNEKVALELQVTNGVNLSYSSRTEFTADSSGIIDLAKDVPSCGSYKDPDLMSIFWAMKPQENSDKRFWPLKIQNGLQCKYKVSNEKGVLTEETVYKDYLAQGVKRIELSEGNIRGTLFVPPGPGPFPTVINMYGGIHKGNVIEDKAALFASRGFLSLSLAFFGVPGLPKSYANAPLELSYFEEAIDFLSAHPKANPKKGVGICGISKAGEIALAMASSIPNDKIGAIAVMNTILKFCVVPAHYKGELLCDVFSPKIDDSTFKHTGPNIINMLGLFSSDDFSEDDIIPFKNCQAPLYFIAGTDDQVSPSASHALWAEKLMKQAGKTNYKIGVHEGLGHLIDLPFSPPTLLSNHPLFPKPFVLEMGGSDIIKHGMAQEKIWNDLLSYFKHYL